MTKSSMCTTQTPTHIVRHSASYSNQFPTASQHVSAAETSRNSQLLFHRFSDHIEIPHQVWHEGKQQTQNSYFWRWPSWCSCRGWPALRTPCLGPWCTVSSPLWSPPPCPLGERQSHKERVLCWWFIGFRVLVLVIGLVSLTLNPLMSLEFFLISIWISKVINMLMNKLWSIYWWKRWTVHTLSYSTHRIKDLSTRTLHTHLTLVKKHRRNTEVKLGVEINWWHQLSVWWPAVVRLVSWAEQQVMFPPNKQGRKKYYEPETRSQGVVSHYQRKKENSDKQQKNASLQLATAGISLQ